MGDDVTFRFREIDIAGDWDTLVVFHRDVFTISYGSDREFSETTYREILRVRLRDFPRGQMLVLDGDAAAGQIEIWARVYEGRRIGYVSLFYLRPPWRGRGLGMELLNYAETFFAEMGLVEYHLRVSSANERAMRFYERAGFRRIAQEQREHITWRMAKRIAAKS